MRSAFRSAALKYSVPSTTAAAAASETACEVTRLPSAVHAPVLQNASSLDIRLATGAEGCKIGELGIFKS